MIRWLAYLLLKPGDKRWNAYYDMTIAEELNWSCTGEARQHEQDKRHP